MFPKRKWQGPPLPWRNLIQVPGQLGLAIAAISFAVMLVFMQLGILGAVLGGATLLYDTLDFDIILLSQKSLEVSFTQPFSRQRLYQVDGLEGVASTQSLYISFGDWQNPETKIPRSIIVLGFNLDETVFESPEINQQLDALRQQDTVLMNRLSRKEFGPKDVGTVTEFKKRKVRIGGLYSMSNSFRFEGSIMMGGQNFIRYYPQRTLNDISAGLVKIQPNADIQAVAERIRRIVPRSILVLTRREAEAKDQQYWITSTSIGVIVAFGVCTALIIGAVIVYQILNTDVSERLPEYGTLKATGYSNQRLAAIVLQQATILSILGFGAGLILGLGLYQVMRMATFLPVEMTLSRALLVFSLTLFMCNASAFISLQRVMRLDPSDVF